MPREIAPGVFAVSKILSTHLHEEVAVGETIGNGAIEESHLDSETATKFNSRIQSYSSASEMISNAPTESMSILNDKLYYRDTDDRFFLISENADDTNVGFPDVTVATPGAATSTYAAGDTLPSSEIELDTAGGATVITFDPATTPAGVAVGMFALVTTPPQASSVTFANNVLTVTPSTDISNNGSFGVRVYARNADSEVTHRFNFSLAIPPDSQGPEVTSVTRIGQASPTAVTDTISPPTPSTPIVIDSSRTSATSNRFVFAYSDESTPVTAAFSFSPESPDQVVSHTVVSNPDANTAAIDVSYSPNPAHNGTFSIIVNLTDSLGYSTTFTQAVQLDIQNMGLISMTHNVDESGGATALWSTSGYTWSAPRSYHSYDSSTQKWSYSYPSLEGQAQSGQTSEPGFLIHPENPNHLDLTFLPGSADIVSFAVSYDPSNPTPPLESHGTSVVTVESNPNKRRLVFDPPQLGATYPANDTYFKTIITMTSGSTTQSVSVYFVYRANEPGTNNFVMSFVFTEPELISMQFQQTATDYTPRYNPPTSSIQYSLFSRTLTNGIDYFLGGTLNPEYRVFADANTSLNRFYFNYLDRPDNSTNLTFSLSFTPENPPQIRNSGLTSGLYAGKMRAIVTLQVGNNTLNETGSADLSGTFQLHLTATDANGVSSTKTQVCRLQVFPDIDASQETRQGGNGTSVTAFDGVVSGSIQSRNTYGGWTTAVATTASLVSTPVSYVNQIAGIDYNKGVRHWSIHTSGNTSSTQPYIGYQFSTWKAITRVKFVGVHSTSMNTSNIRFDYLNTSNTWVNLAITSVRNRANGLHSDDRTLNFEGASNWQAQGWYHDDVVSSNRHNEFTVNNPVWAKKYRLRYVRAQTDYGYGQTEENFGRTSLGSLEMIGVSI